MLTQYTYDSLDRVISETRSGPGMMTEMTTYDYTPVDPSDPVLPVDTRPRTVVRKLNGIECERTYYVYSPLTNIVERVGTQGAAYGGTNVLRTVTTFYPVSVGASLRDARSGFVASVRHEDGKLDLYDYELSSNIWIRTVTHLHEQSPSPVSGKTTRDITVTNARGETSETRTEAFIDGIWYTISRNRMTYNEQGKRITSENLAGQVTTTAWDCCHKVSEVQPDGSTTTWDYDDEGRVIASSRLIPLDMTNVTWLTTCYKYDALGRQVAIWQTNYSAQVGLPATRTRYDQLGRVIARVDTLGNTTTTTYSPDGRTLSIQHPNGATAITTQSAYGDTLSIAGTAVTPEFHTYGILPDGTRWSRLVQGETANSPRFTKYHENLLDQTIREERSGFQGAVLATTHAYDTLGRLFSSSSDYEPITEYTYDVLGNRVATTKKVGRGVPTATNEWRKTETLSNIAIIDGDVWLTQTNIVSCSNSSIAPLVTSSSRQLDGLFPAIPARSRTTDVRDNVTENELLVSLPFVTSRQTVPYATNKSLRISRYGVELQTVSVSAVTNTIAYDSLGRKIANTDCHGNTKHAEYNTLGQRSATIDALGNRTTYTYDQFGNLAFVVNPLGCAIVYEHDLRGRKTYEGGATYPVRYTYDVFGNKTTMMTYRDESLGPDSGDVTTWLYDEASNCMTNKVYSDGKGPTYFYMPDGKLSRRLWARGVATDYSYDAWGVLRNRTYSDATPAVTFIRDAAGRLRETQDAAGTTLLCYDVCGMVTNEVIISSGITNTIVRRWDAFGRRARNAVNGNEISSVSYDNDSGQVAFARVFSESNMFHWVYNGNANQIVSVEYPNGISAGWRYDAGGNIVTQLFTNGNNVLAQYKYDYDILNRKSACQSLDPLINGCVNESYLYDAVGGLTNYRRLKDGVLYECSYEYDSIGNRINIAVGGTNVVLITNRLNQHVGSHTFDDDGNQIVLITDKGEWRIEYDAENRPVHWQGETETIRMTYDGEGRRVRVIEEANGAEAVLSDRCFCYDGDFCVMCVDGAQIQYYAWDPTCGVMARPLAVKMESSTFYYLCTASKNICGMVDKVGNVVAGYSYSPFGELGAASGPMWQVNPWRFSSEYYDDSLGLVYYKYRHYNPSRGRWISRDPIGEQGGLSLYGFVNNDPVNVCDVLGLSDDIGGLLGIDFDADVASSMCNAAIETKNKATEEEGNKKANSQSSGGRSNGSFIPASLSPTEDAVCHEKINKSLGSPLVKKLYSQFSAACPCPEFKCDCCVRNIVYGTELDAPGGYSLVDKNIKVCWNIFRDTKYPDGYDQNSLQRTLAHELTHALQHCRSRSSGENPESCIDNIKWEIEARKCSGECDGLPFEDCLQRALWSSCGKWCTNPVVVKEKYQEIKSWYERMEAKGNANGGWCKFNERTDRQ